MTDIDWADEVWNFLLGCQRVTAGCDTCYAIRQAKARAGHPNPKVSVPYTGLVQRDDTGRLDWTDVVRVLPERLTKPLRWREPRKVFVNSMSDVFHRDVPIEVIAQALAVIALTPRHQYLLLTKRHARMRAVLTDQCRCGDGHQPGTHLRSRMAWAVSKANPKRLPGLPDDAEQTVWRAPWPLPNLWVGVSVESQATANTRIPALLDTPAAVRWISAEPLLGPIDLKDAIATKGDQRGHGCTASRVHTTSCRRFHGIDWVPPSAPAVALPSSGRPSPGSRSPSPATLGQQSPPGGYEYVACVGCYRPILALPGSRCPDCQGGGDRG